MKNPKPHYSLLGLILSCHVAGIGALRLVDTGNLGLGARVPQYPNDDKLVYIGIVSAPDNFHKRQALRDMWVNQVAKQWPDRRVVAEFIIGHPPLHEKMTPGHVQGQLASAEIVTLEEKIGAESKGHGDIFRIPQPDLYQTLPDKTLLLLGRGVDQAYKFIVKVDDDQILDLSHLESLTNGLKRDRLMYMGVYLWNTKAYESQLGADQKFHSYYSGTCYGLSFDLAKEIVSDHNSHSIGFAAYGSASEDVDVGKWVSHLAELHKTTGQNIIDYMTVPGLCKGVKFQ